jgi:FtsH-binding integral membrane protein
MPMQFVLPCIKSFRNLKGIIRKALQVWLVIRTNKKITKVFNRPVSVSSIFRRLITKEYIYTYFTEQNEKEIELKNKQDTLSVNMRTAISLTEIFVVAILLAFLVTFINGTTEMRVISVAFITPVTVLGLAFSYYCRKRKVWSFAGASVLGILGVILRVVVSTQPGLEVGGGIPVAITALYIVLGALMALKNYESVLELRT